jgi:hypothetical protein
MTCKPRALSSVSRTARVELSKQLDCVDAGTYFRRDVAAQCPARELQFRMYASPRAGKRMVTKPKSHFTTCIFCDSNEHQMPWNDIDEALPPVDEAQTLWMPLDLGSVLLSPNPLLNVFRLTTRLSLYAMPLNCPWACFLIPADFSYRALLQVLFLT